MATKLLAHHGQGRVLIMDDQDSVRDVAGMMLESMGYAVTKARDGAEALACFEDAKRQGQPYVAAFFDLTVPGGMGGRALVQALRPAWPMLPIFAASGYSQDPIMAAPQDYGFTASVCKPYLTEDLGAILEEHLKGS